MSKAVEKIGAFNRFGSKLGLERIRELLRRQGDPHKDLKVIHVTGTNGKGSVCRYIYKVLEAAGYKTGIYISPYIEVFNERIECHGQYISDEELDHYTDLVIADAEAMVAEGWDSPTEFEIVTAIAFMYYRDQQADIVVLEVGLGGRGDSTNVIDQPLVSVITSISKDHTAQLGNTLTQIAGEKAGIIKPGCPVVSAVKDPEAAQVIARTAYEKGCVLHDTTRYPVRIKEQSLAGTVFNVEIEGTFHPDVTISMCGRHQVDNAVCALSVIELLRRTGIITMGRQALNEGMKKAVQMVRFEVFQGEPLYILDGAHNPGGMEALLRVVKDLLPGKKILTVMGILADKAVDEVLDYALQIGDDFIATEPYNDRKMGAETLADKIIQRGGNCVSAADGSEALKKAQEMSGDYDVILITGSLYLVSGIRKQITKKHGNQ